MKKTLFIVWVSLLLGAVGCKKDNTVNLGAPLKKYRITAELANSYTSQAGSNLSCFIDLDSGKVYRITEAPLHQNDIDLVYSARNPGTEIYLNSVSNFSTSEFNPSVFDSWQRADLLLDRWTKHNVTKVDIATTAEASLFSTAKYNDELNNISPVLTYIYADASDVNEYRIFFTANKKRGILKIADAVSDNSGFITIDILVQP